MAIKDQIKRKLDEIKCETHRDPGPTSPPGVNPDPLTGQPGSHPAGTSLGAITGGTAGAAVGSALPGVGSIIGAVIGAIAGSLAGGLAGHEVAEVVNPTAEDAYWREELPRRPYFENGYDYDNDWGPAYGYGYAVRSRTEHKSFSDIEQDLKSNWDAIKGKSRLKWDQAKHAVADAWNRWDELMKRHSSKPSDPTEVKKEEARREERIEQSRNTNIVDDIDKE